MTLSHTRYRTERKLQSKHTFGAFTFCNAWSSNTCFAGGVVRTLVFAFKHLSHNCRVQTGEAVSLSELTSLCEIVGVPVLVHTLSFLASPRFERFRLRAAMIRGVLWPQPSRLSRAHRKRFFVYTLSFWKHKVACEPSFLLTILFRKTLGLMLVSNLSIGSFGGVWQQKQLKNGFVCENKLVGSPLLSTVVQQHFAAQISANSRFGEFSPDFGEIWHGKTTFLNNQTLKWGPLSDI